MSTSKPTFNPLPAWSEPLCITPEERVRYLRSLLLDKSEEYQRKNILFLIHLYETGQLKELRPGKITWIFDGKIVDGMPKEVPPGSAVWAERIGLQLMQTTQTPQPIQMPQSASYGLHGVWDMHEIFAKFRLPAIYGGQPNVVLDVSIANDTGSNTQTIFTTDLAFLGYNPHTYTGRLGPTFLSTASGGIYRQQIVLEMQIIEADGTAISSWFEEVAVITVPEPGVPLCRLSGNAMRNFLYFATAPGNSTLYVAKKKNGIISQLPVI
ncbi:hypothetical protein V1517DRAFT_79840 [Lipomyces orientalis]|uniref:Uncharacterized protein n=1 Tax=Lipomyces orientalis TaxID=1233043 RepID=A0ACC3TDP1_9ASCO